MGFCLRIHLIRQLTVPQYTCSKSKFNKLDSWSATRTPLSAEHARRSGGVHKLLIPVCARLRCRFSTCPFPSLSFLLSASKTFCRSVQRLARPLNFTIPGLISLLQL